jgi:glutamate synthase domain-containing protein 3
VDGQLKTGRDVVVGALLGAEEFGFATAPLVVCGCVMMRKCHNNTCPVGVATQDPELRKRFSGKPEFLIAFFTFIAEEVRGLMAQLGFRTFDEMVGRSDRLDINRAITFWKAKGLDFSGVFHQPPPGPRHCLEAQDHGLDQALDYALLPRLEGAIMGGTPVKIEMPIRNVHRTVGAVISSRIARRYGHAGLPPDAITLSFTGAAGQSFGAFASHGMTLLLKGEANDYVGKGLSGGRIVISPYPGAAYDPARNVIAGNVMLYGATAGEVFANGRVGERFCIRNSGATAGSAKAADLLADWDNSRIRFVKVFPMEYRRVLGQMMLEDEATAREEVKSM